MLCYVLSQIEFIYIQQAKVTQESYFYQTFIKGSNPQANRLIER